MMIQLLKVAKFYRRLYSGGHKLVPAIHTSMNFRNFAELYLQSITFKFGNFSNFKALFSMVSTDFSKLVHIKSWKNREKVYQGYLTWLVS